jgi:hypothetical protein
MENAQKTEKGAALSVPYKSFDSFCHHEVALATEGSAVSTFARPSAGVTSPKLDPAGRFERAQL